MPLLEKLGRRLRVKLGRGTLFVGEGNEVHASLRWAVGHKEFVVGVHYVVQLIPVPREHLLCILFLFQLCLGFFSIFHCLFSIIDEQWVFLYAFPLLQLILRLIEDIVAVTVEQALSLNP